MNTAYFPKILAVDDSRTIRSLVDLALKGDYDLSFAENGQSALDLLKDRHFDLILLDIYLPDIDGFQLCSQIKAQAATSEVPIIFLTAATSMNESELGFQLGADDYITKPFNPLELKSRVKARLRGLAKKRA